MTDYEPWAGMNFHYALAAEPLERDRNGLKFLVYRGNNCIAAFGSEKDAKAFRGKKRWKIREIPFYTPIGGR